MFCQWTKAQQDIELETTTVEVRTIAEDLLVPWEILWGADDWIWLTERSGNVKRVNPDNGEIHQLIDIEDLGTVNLSLKPFKVWLHCSSNSFFTQDGKQIFKGAL